MSRSTRERFFHRVLLAAWGMFTLVLLFSLGLVVHELQKRGIDPLALRTSLSPAVSETTASAESSSGQLPDPSTLREATLFFANTDATALAPQVQRIAFGATTVDNCRAAIEALARGPQPGLNPVLPAQVELRGIYLLPNGELVVDFSRELALGMKRSASGEMWMVQAIAHSVCQRALAVKDDITVKSVRFLVEGVPPQGTFQTHLDFARPFTPDSSYLVATATQRESR